MTSSFSSANAINSLYTGCGKDKSKTHTHVEKKDEDVVQLMKKLKKLEAEQIEADKKFNDYVATSNAQQKEIEELSKKQISALQKEISDLKGKLDAEQRRNLELTQQLADARISVKGAAKENDTDDARIEELLSELEMTQEELRESQEANQVAFESIEKFEEFMRQMQQSPQGVASKVPSAAEIKAISAVLNSDAIFRSKRQKAGSLFGEYFTELLKYAKAFGDGKLRSGQETIRDANNNIFPRVEKAAKSIQKFVPNETFGHTLLIMATTFRDYLRAYAEFKEKSKSLVDADQISLIVDEDEFPVKRTVADKFIKDNKNFAQQAGKIVDKLKELYLQIGVIVATTELDKKEEDLNVKRTIEKPLTELLSNLIFYGTAQLSGNADDVTAATKSKEGIISDSKTFGLNLYNGLTASTDRSLVERFNPFKDKTAPAPAASAIKTTAAAAAAQSATGCAKKPMSAKLKFRVVDV